METETAKIRKYVDIYTEVAQNLSPKHRETLTRFAESEVKLPVSLNTLPSGFIDHYLDGDQVVGTLSDFGQRVATVLHGQSRV